MCRNIKPLFNFDPPASDQEINDASLQFVRKISGFREPSKANEAAFNLAVQKIAIESKLLLSLLTSNAKPHNREAEAAKAKKRSQKRFGSPTYS